MKVENVIKYNELFFWCEKTYDCQWNWLNQIFFVEEVLSEHSTNFDDFWELIEPLLYRLKVDIDYIHEASDSNSLDIDNFLINEFNKIPFAKVPENYKAKWLITKFMLNYNIKQLRILYK